MRQMSSGTPEVVTCTESHDIGMARWTRSIGHHFHLARPEPEGMRRARSIIRAPQFFNPRAAPLIDFVYLEYLAFHRTSAFGFGFRQLRQNRRADFQHPDPHANADHCAIYVMCFAIGSHKSC